MIVVKKAGLFSTAQDAGRIGFQQYGVIVGGAMDTVAFTIGNALLHQTNEAAIEMTMFGGTFVFTKRTTIALTGGAMSPTINGRCVPMYTAIPIEAGDVLVCGAIQTRAYVCIKGGIDVPIVMNSRSTYTKAAIGGFHGRALRKGDELLYRETTPIVQTKRVHAKPFYEPRPIRILQGTEWERLSYDVREAFCAATYRISVSSDRMGYRLLPNAPIDITEPFQLISEAVTFGTIQLPPSGEPIVLMADRQTTGGYPKIGQVIYADLYRLAQYAPNDVVTFQVVTLEEAEAAYEKLARQLRLSTLLL